MKIRKKKILTTKETMFPSETRLYLTIFLPISSARSQIQRESQSHILVPQNHQRIFFKLQQNEPKKSLKF